jgi:hypothetical protein
MHADSLLAAACLPACLQDCVLSAGPDEVLPDPEALLLTCDTAELASKRRQVQERQQQRQPAQQGWGSAAAAGAGGSVPGAVSGAGSVPRDAPLDARATGGLLACSGEWVALQLRHTGSWQLSLVYNDEQLRTFTKVGFTSLLVATFAAVMLSLCNMLQPH